MATSITQIIIVGGGPVGLTAAHALYHAGIKFILLERRESVVYDEGASLVLGPPSLRVMHQFGLLDKLLAIGGELQHSKAFTEEGKKFKDTYALRLIRENHGISPVAFHRAHLVEALFEGLPDGAKQCYFLNKKVIDLTSDDNGARVTCADGSVYEGSMVLGADGTHSNTRRLMRNLALSADPEAAWDSETPYTATYKCLWCSFPRTSEIGNTFETSSQDRSIMYITGRDRGWLFLYKRLPKPTSERVSYTEEDAHAFVAEFIEFSIAEKQKVKDVYVERLSLGMANLEEGMLGHWSWGRVALVGDACHKFTPNAGLGLNNGIQDVVVLCNALHKAMQNTPNGQPDGITLHGVFREYQKTRIKPLQSDFKKSARLTRMHAWLNVFYFTMARYLMSWNLVQVFLFNGPAARSIRQGRVLDYIPSKEPFQGSISWEHRMNRDTTD